MVTIFSELQVHVDLFRLVKEKLLVKIKKISAYTSGLIENIITGTEFSELLDLNLAS